MSKQRKKGTAWESRLVGYLRDHGHPLAERRAGNGTQDRGDVAGIPGWCVEAKASVRMELAQWCDEAEREALHAGARWWAVAFPRRHHATDKAYVVMTLAQLAELMAETRERGSEW